MEISAKKTKFMTNNTIGLNKEIKVNGQKLETVAGLSTWAKLHLTRASSLQYSPG